MYKRERMIRTERRHVFTSPVEDYAFRRELVGFSVEKVPGTGAFALLCLVPAVPSGKFAANVGGVAREMHAPS